MNAMRNIRLEKVTLNMGAGEPGPRLDKSKKILATISGGRKVIITTTHKRTTFGGAKNRPIGAMTTIRGKDAAELLSRMFHAVEGKINKSSFDSNGNFSFGIKEYIHIHGMKYDPEVGILGLDVAVTLTRPGYRVKDRMLRSAPIGKGHRITPDEAAEWVAKEFGVKVV